MRPLREGRVVDGPLAGRRLSTDRDSYSVAIWPEEATMRALAARRPGAADVEVAYVTYGFDAATKTWRLVP